MKRYKMEHINFLRENYKTMTAKQLTAAFNKYFGDNRTHSSIRTALRDRGISSGRSGTELLKGKPTRYTHEQIEFVSETYTHSTLGRTTQKFNDRFGTDKNELQIQSVIHRYGIKGSPCKKRPGNKGSFKKGETPPRLKPLYSERVAANGFLEIKVPEVDPYSGASTRWKRKQVYLWEQEYGPVPDGHVVMFKDGDPMKCEIDNLALVTRAEFLRLNKNRYKHQPEELKPVVFAVSKLQAGISAKKKEIEHK